MENSGVLAAAVIIIALTIGVFIVLRLLVLWYWKKDTINKSKEFNLPSANSAEEKENKAQA